VEIARGLPTETGAAIGDIVVADEEGVRLVVGTEVDATWFGVGTEAEVGNPTVGVWPGQTNPGGGQVRLLDK